MLPYHCVKIARIRSFFCSAFSRIWTEWGKMRTRKTPNMNTFNTVFNTPEIARKPFVYRSYELQTLTKNGLIQRKSPAQKIDTFP